LLLILLIGIALITGFFGFRRIARNHEASIGSLAVLPLENLSGDPSQDYFADGMTDELITNLVFVQFGIAKS